ncbi:hypothetical protein HH212_24235 [Massilia forsythiae]|uniref:Uncharacterized protein n=1 Tax=Massilia forsythiae TaxID=2728020 RepID=A0A7Z2W0A4_9BURK|nr:hypothetical protein [Massilia forsythiae]QJE02731.1 hypothetical protein HH212_24235 [Massilia forsythiae]
MAILRGAVRPSRRPPAAPPPHNKKNIFRGFALSRGRDRYLFFGQAWLAQQNGYRRQRRHIDKVRLSKKPRHFGIAAFIQTNIDFPE